MKEGVADIAEELREEEMIDERIQKKMAPQPVPHDPVTDKKSRRNMYILAGTFGILFLIIITFTLLRDEEVATVKDMSGHLIKGIVDERFRYNEFNFVNIDTIWYTELLYKDKKITIPLHYSPRDVENITLLGELDNRFTDARLIYIAFNPLDHNLTYVALANGELSLSLVRAMNLLLKAACTQNQTYPCAKQPILSCDSDHDRAIIELRQSNETSVTYKGNCILITGDNWNLVKAVDRLLLKWYGIIK